MSRPARAGEPGRLLNVRVTDAERERWETAAKHAGADLSAWLRQAADELASAGRERRRGWMRPVPLTGSLGRNAPSPGNTRETAARSRRNPRR